MKVYCVGNVLVEEDSLPIRLMPRLQKEMPEYSFEEFDPSENFPKKLVLIDTAINAGKVFVLTDISRLQTERVCSLHDFDLAYNLKLMKKFGIVNAVKIICVPPSIREDVAVKEIKDMLRASLSSRNA